MVSKTVQVGSIPTPPAISVPVLDIAQAQRSFIRDCGPAVLQDGERFLWTTTQNRTATLFSPPSICNAGVTAANSDVGIVHGSFLGALAQLVERQLCKL